MGVEERVRKERERDGEEKEAGEGLGAVGAAVHEGERNGEWIIRPTGLKQSNGWRIMDPRPLLVGFER
jgi:hypothetical protein